MTHRILHVADSLDRFSPAADMLALAEALPNSEFEQHVAVLGHLGALSEQVTNVATTLQCLEQRWTYDPTTLVRLIACIKAVKPSLIHTWDLSSRKYAELVLPRAGNTRLLAQFDLSQSASGWPMPKRWRHSPDRIVVRSEAVRQTLEKCSVRDAGAVVVEPGVAPARESVITREQLLRELQLPSDARLLAAAGPLEPRYGVKELIWAADMVRVLHPNMRFLIVGDGRQRRHLERFAQTAAEPENICLLGDSDRWPDILPHVDVYWQGTEVYAISPTTMLEAMATGVPVVATDTPQHRELIDNGESGYLVTIDDRAARTRITDQLLNESDTASAIGKASRDRVEQQFSLTARAAKFASLYRELA